MVSRAGSSCTPLSVEVRKLESIAGPRSNGNPEGERQASFNSVITGMALPSCPTAGAGPAGGKLEGNTGAGPQPGPAAAPEWRLARRRPTRKPAANLTRDCRTEASTAAETVTDVTWPTRTRCATAEAQPGGGERRLGRRHSEAVGKLEPSAGVMVTVTVSLRAA
jgi:hypothetical protein